MLAHSWGYYWLKEVHPANNSILNCYYVMIQIVPKVSFYQWSTYFSSFKNTTWKIQHAYNIFIQHSGTTCTTHTAYSNTTRSCSKTLVGNPAGQDSRYHDLPIWLQDRPNSGIFLHQMRPFLLSFCPKASAAAFLVSKKWKRKS